MKKTALGLPECPYCGQHFSYKDVFQSKRYEDKQCPKCKQKFKVTLETPFSVLVACIVVAVVIINICLGLFVPGMNMLYMVPVMALGVVVAVSMLPLVVRYVKPEEMKYSTRTTRHKR